MLSETQNIALLGKQNRTEEHISELIQPAITNSFYFRTSKTKILFCFGQTVARNTLA